MQTQPKSDEFWRSILTEEAYALFLKYRSLFRFVFILLPMLTGFLAIAAGILVTQYWSSSDFAITSLAIQLPRIEYGVEQLALGNDSQYRNGALITYTLFALLAIFWFIFSLILALWLHWRFHRSASYRFRPHYGNLKKTIVLSGIALVVLIYHMVIGVRFFPYAENPSSFRMPPNRAVFVFESICLSALSMFLIVFVVSIGHMYSYWSQSKSTSDRFS